MPDTVTNELLFKMQAQLGAVHVKLGDFESHTRFVIPAQAGIHNLQTFGVCGIGDAHALGSEYMDSRLRGNDGVF